MSVKIDLHSHTTASDGQLTPSELVLRAEMQQVNVLAITDHDTCAGINEAKHAIEEHNLKLKLIDGVEISSSWQSFGIHIVGVKVDPEQREFSQFIKQQKVIRLNRAKKIGEKLDKTGFGGIYDQAHRMAKGGELTRAHFARALVEFHGLGSMNHAFQRFMGKGKVGDVKAQWPHLGDVIKAIQGAGGQAILAHPLKYDMTTKWLRRLIADFSSAGGDAVEVAGPGVVGEKSRLLHDIVAQYGLKGSVGSDFHGPGRWTEIGRFQSVLPGVTPIWHDW